MYWYYVLNGQQMGPVPKEEFDRLVAAGTISNSTLVWSDGMDNWKAYGEVRGGTPALTAAVTRSTSADPVGDALSSGSLLAGGTVSYTQLGEGVGSTGDADTVVCGSCGRPFRRDETIQYGTTSVCAACKPMFFQRIKEGAAVPGSMVYASPWYRVGATFIDNLILYAVGTVLGLLWQGVAGQPDSVGSFGALQLFAFLANMLYPTYMLGKYQATVGQMALKIKTVRADGSAVTYSRAFGRFFAEMLSGLLCGIGYLIAFFDDEKRTLHDRMCDTRVVMK